MYIVVLIFGQSLCLQYLNRILMVTWRIWPHVYRIREVEKSGPCDIRFIDRHTPIGGLDTRIAKNTGIQV